MARDTDKRATGLEAENTGGMLSEFWPKRTFSTAGPPAAGRVGVASVGAVVLVVYVNQSSTAARRGTGRSARQTSKSRLWLRKSGRSPAVGWIRDRDPQWRSRPAVFPCHRAGTGPGDRDRRHLRNNRPPPPYRRHQPRRRSCQRPQPRRAIRRRLPGRAPLQGPVPAPALVPGRLDRAEARR